MKKVLLSTVLASTALVLLAVPASADEPAVVSSETTDLGIRFETDGPNKPGEGPFKDNLAIAFVPSKFDFGSQKATGNIATYNNTVEGKQYFIVNEDRKAETEGGDLSAWNAKATLSAFSTGDAADDALNAKLTFNLGAVQKYNIGDKVDPTTNDFIPQDPSVAGALETLPKDDSIVLGGTDSKVTLEAGGTTSTPILGKNKANKSTGGFATEISNTKLVVATDKKSAGKAYKATLSWSLENTY